jgi:hypothetical protein
MSAQETPVVVTPPPPSNDPGAKGLLVRWTPADPAALSVGVDFAGIASKARFLVAVGARGDDEQSVIWASPDETNWAVAYSPEEGGAAMDLAAVAAGSAGFVVVGSYPTSISESGDISSTGAVYISTDGVSWKPAHSELFVDQTLDGAAVSGSNYVVFSAEGAIFGSADGGVTWHPVDSTPGVAPHGPIVAVTQDDSTIWALAADGRDLSTASRRLEVWRSLDGLSWERTGTIEGAHADQAWIAHGPSGLSVVTAFYNRNPRLWDAFQSADGVSWQRAPSSPADVTDLLGTYAGFVAVGHYNLGAGCALDETDDVGVTWTSVDGLLWRHMPEKGWKGHEVQVVGESGSSLVGLGVDRTYDYGDGGRLWTAPLPGPPKDLAPQPSPTPEPTPALGCGS